MILASEIALDFNDEKKLKTSIDYLSKKLVGYEFAINKKKKQLYILKTQNLVIQENILFQKIL